MLAFGVQPSSIRIWGPHVRGFTKREFTNFFLSSGHYELVAIIGVGFYPFPQDSRVIFWRTYGKMLVIPPSGYLGGRIRRRAHLNPAILE